MYYKPNQAARLLGIARRTLIRWEELNRIPPAKRNYLNHRVYTKEDLENIKKIIGLGIIKEPSKLKASK